ncbi:MAG: hypothetical protein WCW87_00095 [Candidatus Paceibacterota bacterium]
MNIKFYLSIVAIFSTLLFVALSLVFNHKDISLNEKIMPVNFSEDQAIAMVKARYPEFADYPSNDLPPKTVMTTFDVNGWYVAFIKKGLVFPVVGANCFLVKGDSSIVENGKFTPDNSTISKEDFSPKTCK